MRILLAGATGVIGSEISAALRQQGHLIVRLSRAAGVDALRPETLRGYCDDIETVVSAMGGSVALDAPERRPYRVTNTEANRNLLREAERGSVRRFLYVAAHSQPGYAETAYMRSHEEFVGELDESPLSYTVLRPTAIFQALAPFVGFARRGFVPLIGDGAARTNPISARDVARAAMRNLASGPKNVPLGGPDIYSRREIVELAAAAAGCKPTYMAVSRGIAEFNARAAGLFRPRLGELIAFAAAVSTQDCIAPCVGEERLPAYFEALARA